MVTDYRIISEDNKVVVYSDGVCAGEIVFPTAVRETIKIEEGILVLLEQQWTNPTKSFQSLLLASFSGEVLWYAELPNAGGADSYVDVRMYGTEISAYSFSGYICTIDRNTGKIVARKFVK